jgi:hypothetical protein
MAQGKPSMIYTHATIDASILPIAGMMSLILPPLQQPLRHLILLDYVDVGAPPRQSIAVDSVQQRLRNRLEEVFRSLLNATTFVSINFETNPTSRPQPQPYPTKAEMIKKDQDKEGKLTRSGSQSPSHVPNS